jgi:hypothetical protein
MIYTKESDYGSDGRMYAGMFIDKEPAEFPKDTSDVPDLKNGYRFAVGSYLYIVATAKVFMYDGTNWIEQ